MPHATRQKAFGRSANTPPRFRLFLDRHLHCARRVPGRGRYRRLLADLHSHRTDAHAPGRRSPGHPVRLPSLRASPLDGLGGELHAQRSRASLLPRIPFRPRRRRDRSCGRHSHGWLLHLVLPALGNVLRNRRPAARSHLHSPFGGHVGGPLLAHLPSALNRCGSDRRLRAAVSGASLPSEEPRRDRGRRHSAPHASRPKTRRGRPMAARALRQYPRVFVEAHRWHRASPKLRRRRGARRFRGGGPFGGGPRAVSLEGLRHPAYLPGALPHARSRWPSCS